MPLQHLSKALLRVNMVKNKRTRQHKDGGRGAHSHAFFSQRENGTVLGCVQNENGLQPYCYF